MAARVLTITAIILTVSLTTHAALFSDDFDVDSSANWNINTSSDDNSVIFAFDYSTIGVPPSPNGGGTTLGLRLAANINTGTPVAVTLSPIGYNFTGVYMLQFDMWINANGPFPGGGTGSTEYVTAGIGYDNLTVNKHGDSGYGGWFAVSGEGGSSRDYRPYKNDGEQWPASGQFLAGDTSTANNSSHLYYADFGEISVPVAVPDQTKLYPLQQIGTTLRGAPGFAWHKVTVTVDGEYALWSIDDLPIARLNPNIGAAFDLDGNISIGYMDPFGSISDNDALSFGIIDNLIVFADPVADYLAHNPTPADNEKRASTTAPLTWEPPFEIDPIGYDVFLRENDPNFTLDDRVVSDELTNRYPPPEDELELKPLTQYFWRVDVHDPNDPNDTNDLSPFWHQGTLWTFTTASPDPVIDQHPQPVVTVPAGDQAELSVVAINGYTYQWFKIDQTGGPDTEVPGAILSTLTIDAVQLTNEGYYYCLVKNKDDIPAYSDSGRILTKRMMAHWKLDDSLTDEVDPANDGYSPAIITYEQGIDGRAVKIAASDRFVQIDNEIGLLNAVTISLWVKPAPEHLLDTALFFVSQDGPPDYAGPGSIQISADARNFSANVSNSGLDASVPGLIADQWNHLLLVHDPARRQARLYLNGLLSKTVTGIDPDVLPNVTALGIGARNPSDIAGIFDQGLIDDVRIYNSAISSLNAASLYTGFVPDANVCLDSVIPQYDLNGDCIFNLQDFAEIAATWLECNLVPDCIQPQLP